MKDRSAPGAWLYGGSNPWAPVAILVKRSQLAEARIVLAEIAWERPAVDAAEARRPDVAPAHALTWWAAALALGVVLTSVALLRTAETLEKCGIPIVCPGGTEGAP